MSSCACRPVWILSPSGVYEFRFRMSAVTSTCACSSWVQAFEARWWLFARNWRRKPCIFLRNEMRSGNGIIDVHDLCELVCADGVARWLIQFAVFNYHRSTVKLNIRRTMHTFFIFSEIVFAQKWHTSSSMQHKTFYFSMITERGQVPQLSEFTSCMQLNSFCIAAGVFNFMSIACSERLLSYFSSF